MAQSITGNWLKKPNKLIVEGNYSGKHVGSLELRKKIK